MKKLITIGLLALACFGYSETVEEIYKKNQSKNAWTNYVTEANVYDWCDFFIKTNLYSKANVALRKVVTAQNGTFYITNTIAKYPQMISKIHVYNNKYFSYLFPTEDFDDFKKYTEQLYRTDYINTCHFFSTYKIKSIPRYNEYIDLVKSIIKPEVVKTFDDENYSRWFSIVKIIDNIEKDTSRTIQKQIYTKEKAPALIKNNIVKAKWYIKNKTSFYNQVIEDAFNESNDEFVIIETAKAIDTIANYENAYTRVTENNKLEVAVELNSIDKVIDVLLTGSLNFKPNTLNDAIAIINVVTADYRKVEILTALKNLNSQYTLKLYDDHDTWEPILSKVRALIDIRQ